MTRAMGRPALLFAACAVTALTSGHAQAVRQHRHGGGRAAQAQIIERQPLDTLTGAIVTIEAAGLADSGAGSTCCAAMGRAAGGGQGLTAVQLRLAGDSVAVVELGPAWYLRQQIVDPLSVGQVVTVEARPIPTRDGRWAAASISRGDLTVYLRDDAGRPRWAGARHQQHHARPGHAHGQPR